VSIFFNMAASANIRIWNSLFLLEFCVFSPVSIYIYIGLFFCIAVQPVKSVLPVGSATTTCIPVGSACTSEYVEAAAPVILIE